MSDNTFWQRVAHLLRKFPRLMSAAYTVWQWRQAKFTAGVVGVVLDDARRVLLVEHVFHPRTPWGLPGGWIDRSENPADTLRRELREELALTVHVAQVLLVDMGEHHNHFDMAYLCFPRGEVGALSYELLSYRWMNAADLPVLQPFHARAIQRALDTDLPENKL